jgi:multiple sugar transport system ATP-binding protein
VAKIILQNVRKHYKGGLVKALRDVNLDCDDGKFFCLLGPVGAGKSTTIKMIAGIEPVDLGSIFLGEQDITDWEPKDRDVAVTFETYALYPHRTVRENLSFPLEAPIRKGEWSQEQIKNRVEEIARLLGIDDLLDRLPRQLSGGQRQRVALGRALVRKPKAYLLDEPIAHLDAKLRHRMRGELKRIQLEMCITMFYTTPDQLEALSLADTIAVLNNGQIEQVGAPDEIYNRPANTFVARFVGEPPMNLLEASLSDGDLHFTNDLRIKAPTSFLDSTAGEPFMGEIIVGIRPKDLQIVAADSTQALLKVRALHTQVLGETSVVTAQTDSDDLRIKIPTSQAPEKGENIGISFAVESCHYFDPLSQRRIGGLPSARFEKEGTEELPL